MRYDIYVRLRDAMDEFVESEHPRDDDGKFTDKNGGSSSGKSDVKLLKESGKSVQIQHGNQTFWLNKNRIGPDVAKRLGVKLSESDIQNYNARKKQGLPVGLELGDKKSATTQNVSQTKTQQETSFAYPPDSYTAKIIEQSKKLYKKYKIPQIEWNLEEAKRLENDINWPTIQNELKGINDAGYDDWIENVYLKELFEKEIDEQDDDDVLFNHGYEDDGDNESFFENWPELRGKSRKEIANMLKQFEKEHYYYEWMTEEKRTMNYQGLYDKYLKSIDKLDREESFDAIYKFISETLEKSGYRTSLSRSRISDSRYVYVSDPKNPEFYFVKIRLSDHDDRHNTENATIELFTSQNLSDMMADVESELPEFYEKYLNS